MGEGCSFVATVWSLRSAFYLLPSIQSDVNRGTGVPPVITAGTAVPRQDAKLLVSFCIVRGARFLAACGPLKITLSVSFPRKRESIVPTMAPAFAGMTALIFIFSGGLQVREN